MPSPADFKLHHFRIGAKACCEDAILRIRKPCVGAWSDMLAYAYERRLCKHEYAA